MSPLRPERTERADRQLLAQAIAGMLRSRRCNPLRRSFSLERRQTKDEMNVRSDAPWMRQPAGNKRHIPYYEAGRSPTHCRPYDSPDPRVERPASHLASAGGTSYAGSRAYADLDSTKVCCAQVVAYIKGKSAIHLARVYGEMKRNFVCSTSGPEGTLSPQ
jgi:hypothetical protein